jgi:PAS domain S-box-containing protein
VEITIALRRDADGRPLSLIGAAEDITDRKRAQEELCESEERFRSYFELGLIGMAITSPSKGILEVNEEICKTLGYERDELLRKTWTELIIPAISPPMSRNLTVFSSGRSTAIPRQTIYPQGRPGYLRYHFAQMPGVSRTVRWITWL